MADVYDQLLDEQQPTIEPVAPAQGADAYDAILNEFSAQQDAALKQSLGQAMKVLPQQAATTQQLAKASGLPADLVERNKDTVQQQVKMRELQSLLAASPILARQMQDPAFAKLAQNDANTLSTLERLWRQPSGGAVEGLGMGTAGIGDTLSILQRNFMEGFSRTFLPEPIGGWDKVDSASLAGPLVGADWQTVGNYLKAQGRDIQIPQLQQDFWDKVLAGVGQVGAQIGVGLATGGVGSGAFLYGQGVNAMTEKTQGDDASQGAKDLAALLGGGVTAITEKWALDKLLGPMTVPIQNQLGAALARIGIAGASEGAQETIESLAQDSLRKFLTNPDAEIQIGQAFEEGGVGATVGALVRTVVESAAGVRSRAIRTEQQAAQAEQNTAMIEQLNQLAAASELLKTSPETFQQFIEQAAEDGDVQDVYIDAQFLMQSGMADQLAQVSPAIAQQLPTALATGGTVQIPVGEYAAKIAPTEFAQGLLDHLKTDPQGFSRAEAQEYFQTQQQQLEQEIAQQLETKAGDQEFMDSKERVKQTVLTELNNLGRFTPQKNELDATLIAARTAVRAAQLGMTPEAFFEKQRLSFAAERIDGQAVPDVDVSAPLAQIKSAKDRAGYEEGVRNLGASLPDGSTITDNDTGTTWKVRKYTTKSGTEVVEFDTGGNGDNSFQFAKKKEGEWAVLGDLYFPKDFEIKQPARQANTFSQGADPELNKLAEFYSKDDVYQFDNYQEREDAIYSLVTRYATDGNFMGMQLPSATGFVTVTPSSKEPGKWQVSMFDKNFVPLADNGLQSKEDALRYFFEQARPSADQYNQSGQLQTDTPAFKNWFGDSKVVDEDGKPLVVYHGTTTDFNAFSSRFQGAVTRATSSKSGFFFTNSPRTAQSYADFGATVSPVQKLIEEADKAGDRGDWDKYDEKMLEAEALEAELANPANRGRGQNIMPVYLSMKNPLVIDANGETPEGIGGIDPLIQKAKRAGHDGVIIRNFDDAAGLANDNSDHYIVFNPTQIKSAVGNRGTFDPNDPNILNQFAGVRSETADLGQLEVAKDLADRGMSAAQIQRQTGWTKGVDGKWRYEISDDQVKFVKHESVANTAVFSYVTRNADVSKSLDGKFSGSINFGNELYVATGESREQTISELANTIARENGLPGFDIDTVQEGQEISLANAIEHPALFAAYPSLRTITVKFVKDTDYNGMWDEKRNTIELNIDRNNDEKLSTLLHEVQHAIQSKENFARGGSSEQSFVTAVKRAVASLQSGKKNEVIEWKESNYEKLIAAHNAAEVARNALKYQSAQRLIDYSKRDKPSGVFRLLRNEMQWIYGEEFYGNRQARDLQGMFYDLPRRGPKRNPFLSRMAWEGAQFLLDSIPADQLQTFKNDPRTLQSLIKALEREASKARKELAPLRELENEARSAKVLDEKTMYKAPFEVYRALAGEIEARTTQARQKLTAEERRNRPIRVDMDVDPSEAIVVMGGLELRVPSVMRSQAAPTPRGAFNPNTNTIALMKGADLSTFLHEAGHYFFESDIALANEIAQGNALFGAESMTQGESEILNDVGQLFTWFGFEGDVNTQLATWNGLSFEQKRAYHEKTAESFERYLFEGKAPSIELQSYFQQFRAWLVNVYKSIKDFITNNPAAGELTDEVRAVFDRMLATNEEIQLAEQARSMMPLFRTKQDADNIGMTPEEFRAYQKQDVDATNDAIQDMQARAVRDLQWTRNAHNREVKRLQRQAGELRKEAKDEAKAQVGQEPVYKAWQFLTRKLEDSDRVTPVQRPKTDPNVVEPMADSMFTAIAKLGGLNKQEAVETWGVEEAERPNSGVFGKPVLRAKGGKSIDGMVEALAQYGYLPLDENGKADIADFETKFDDELRGDPQYSVAYDYSIDDAMALRPGEQMDITALTAGRFDIGALMGMDLTSAEIELLKARRMTAKDGLHPDLVAELPGIEMSSGDELVRKLLAATPLKEEIEARAETIMLERHGELASPEAISREADKAIHSEARAKMVATEANALARATGERKILAKAAKALAQTMVARIKVRDIKPTQYASAEARAAKNAAKASKEGDLRTAAAEKRSQLVNTYATRAAYEAQDDINAALRYLNKFDKEGTRKGLDVEYLDQIDALLERFDLRKGQSLKAIDKRESLAKWIAAQEDAGIEPDLPDYILAEANRVHYKNLTVEEFRGLVDSIKQIEHLGRLKKKLLTAKDDRELDAIVDEIKTRIEESSGGRVVDNEVRNTVQDQLRTGFEKFMLAHRKAASVARQLDGVADGGPMWEYFTRSMNKAGDYEVTKRAETAQKLHELAKPILDGEKMGGKGRFFPSLNRNLNRGERIAIALNWGNDSNRQRLLGGKGWTAAQIQPVLDTLTAQEWQFVQGVWDLFESFRPEIGAKEKRVSGKEPEWIEATPLDVTTSDGQRLQLRGGYYPVKFDPRQSGKAGEHADAETAKQMMRAAYTASTTRRSFTKSRVEEVQGRPLLLSFDGIYQGMNEVIHDLAWHEWLIDANKLLRRLDKPIRTNYGADYVDTLKKAVKDIALGDTPAANAFESVVSHVRNGSTIVGMGWNLTTALLQPLGYTQSIVRVGGKWMARGLSEFFGTPSHMIAKAEEVQGKSKLMANRALTLNREINDVRNRLETSKSEVYQRVEATFFIMIQKMQAMVDYPTWLAAYDKALADPANDEQRAIALADQAVLDAQGGGQTKDLAMIQRGGPLLKLFTNFYSYFNVLYNLTAEQTTKRVKAKEYGGLLTDYALLMIVPAVLSAVLRNVLKGEDDEDEYAKAIASELVGYPFGMFLGVREMAEAVKLATGLGNPGLGYSGPAGLRFFSEMNKLGAQVGQGELDWALFKALNNTAGILFHYPAGQVNRMVEGTAALIDGKTENPLAPLTGVQR